MILLDTDHLTIMAFPESEQHASLTTRMALSSEPVFATTIVNAEEQLHGWLAGINRQKTPLKQIPAYERLQSILTFLRPFSLLAFD